MLKKYSKKIDAHTVVSFDVYDTLIKRNVNKPSDVFDLVEMQYYLMEGRHIQNYKQKRCTAYERAYKQHGSRCKLDDIFDNLSLEDGIDVQKLKQIEIMVEIDISVANMEMLDIYEYALEHAKKVVLITDMYLPLRIIINILSKCGITQYDEILLSSEYGKSKTDGGLYNICLEKLKIHKEDLLHFGDGWKNDVLRARLKGIDCCHVSSKSKLDYDDDSDFSEKEKKIYSMQQALIRNLINSFEDERERLGFEVFGPLVHGFCIWLHCQFYEAGLNKIYFLAREGMLFKNIYQTMYPEDELEIHYLYVSRKSLVSPTYWIEPDYDSVMNSIAKSGHISVANQVERWGLSSEECSQAIRQAGLMDNDILDGRRWKNNDSLKHLFELLKDKIITNSKINYKLLEDYLKQENFGGKCAIIDIGWNGGMQNAFQKIASIWKEPTTIHGFYIGINPKNLGSNLLNIRGYVYDESHGEKNRYYIYSFAGPLELSLTAPHPTTIGYRRNNTGIEPVYGNTEYIGEDSSAMKEIQYIKAVQMGILSYVNKAGSFRDIFPDSVTSEVAFRNCRQFGLKPLKKHIAIFQEFEANDLGEYQHFVNPRYRRLYGDESIIKGFWKSTWKSGYMKYLFKLPFPYHKIYVFFRKSIEK